jgi:hypothetical protein
MVEQATVRGGHAIYVSQPAIRRQSDQPGGTVAQCRELGGRDRPLERRQNAMVLPAPSSLA